MVWTSMQYLGRCPGGDYVGRHYAEYSNLGRAWTTVDSSETDSRKSRAETVVSK